MLLQADPALPPLPADAPAWLWLVGAGLVVGHPLVGLLVDYLRARLKASEEARAAKALAAAVPPAQLPAPAIDTAEIAAAIERAINARLDDVIEAVGKVKPGTLDTIAATERHVRVVEDLAREIRDELLRHIAYQAGRDGRGTDPGFGGKR